MSERMAPDQVRAVVEAVLMTADAPVSPGKLQSLIKGINGRDIRQAIDELNEQYRAHGHAMSVVEVAGGFQVATRREYGPWVRKFHDRGYVRLTQAGLETLAIVAYNQPVTKSRIEQIRGVESSATLKSLLDRGLAEVVGRKDVPGRPMLYGTTHRFLEIFGLPDLASLPPAPELERLEIDTE